MSYTESRYNSLAFDAGEAPRLMPDDPNYRGPSPDEGKAKYDLASEAAMFGGIFKAVKNPIGTTIRGLEAYGLATATDEERAREANLETSVQKLATLASPLASIPGAIEGGKKLFKDVSNALNPQFVPSTVGRYNGLAFDAGSDVKVSNVFASTGTGTSLRPSNFKDTRKWNNWVKKFEGEKGAKQAADIEAEAKLFWDSQKKLSPDGKGSLKDFGTLREIDGKQYYIKNKANSLKEPNFNFDSLENTVAGRIMRESSAKVEVKDVQEAVKRINKNRQLTGEPPITTQQTTDYLNAQRKNKRDIQTLIRNLNYDQGKGTWSLGHIEAVKSHTKKGKKGADMITNLELEPFRDMFDSKTGRWIQGNASRSDKDELTDLLLQAINKAETLDEDIVKFLDPVVGGYWPRKGKVTNQKTWMKEQIKLEKYLESVKKKGADKTLQESGVMDTSIYEGTKLPNLSR